MTGQILLREKSSNHLRQQPLLANQSPSGSTRFAEVAGRTAAECAAVCCCCPCGLVNLLILAVYKLPAGLCRKALKKKKKRLKSAAGLFSQQQQRCACGCQELHSSLQASDALEKHRALSEKEVNELEKEMLDHFYNNGFGRSSSQKD